MQEQAAETGKTTSFGDFEALTSGIADGLQDRFPDPLNQVASFSGKRDRET